MPETRARDLANLAGAGATSSTVAYHETARSVTLPAGTGENNQVISSNGNGTTTWADVALTPDITGLTWYSDSGYSSELTSAEAINLDDATYLKVTGLNFGSSSAFQASAYVQIINTTQSNSIVGNNQNGLSLCVTGATYVSETEVRFTINPNGISGISAGDTLKVKFITTGGESLFATGYVVSADPTSVTTVNSATIANTQSVGSFGGLVTGGGDDSNTKLLLNFDRMGGTDFEDSSNRSGEGHKITASGNAVIKASPFGDGKSAIFFNGSSDYLSIPADSTSDFTFSTNSFTIEFWAYFNDTNTHRIIGADADHHGLGISLYSSKIRVYVGNGSSWVNTYDGASTLEQERWYHIAVLRNSGVLKLYVDGKEDFSNTNSVNLSDYEDYFYIGRNHGTSDEFDGFLDEIRVVQGTNATDGAVYSSDFTVPTSRLTAITNTKLLIHSNQNTTAGTTFTDSSSDSPASNTAHIITRSGAYHTTAHGGIAPAMAFPASQKKTGSAGVYFDGNGDYLEEDDAGKLEFGTNPFIIECFFNMSSIQQANSSVSVRNIILEKGGYNQSDGWVIMYASTTGTANNDGIVFVCDGGSTVVGWTNTLNTNTWYHVAVTRQTDNYIRLYVNGTLRANTGDTSTTVTTNFGASTTYKFRIGQSYNSSYQASNRDFNGYVDAVRVVEGGDGVFSGTVPTQIYGSIKSNTIDTITLTGTAGTGGGYVTFNNATLSGNTETTSPLPSGLTLNEAESTDNTATITGDLTASIGSHSINLVARVTSDGTNANIDPNRKQAYSHTIDKASGGSPVLFNGRRYHGSETTKSITGFNFAPDLIWAKSRTSAWHQMHDTVRGISGSGGGVLYPNDSNVAETTSAIQSFDSDGFTLHDSRSDSINSDNGIVAWGFKAGGAPSAYGKKKINGVESSIAVASSYNLSDGDYYNLKAHDDSSYGMKQSINTTGGFSITKFSLGATSDHGWFKHGFSGDPDWVIIRRVDATYNWDTWHSGLTTSWNANQTLRLNTNESLVTGRGNIFTDSSDSNGFPKGDGKIHIDRGAIYGGDENDEFICYVWKAVAGVSAMGSYTGNGSGGGVKQTTNFRPKWIMTKSSNSTSPFASWTIIDGFRSDFGTSGTKTLSASETLPLYADLNKQEGQRSNNTNASVVQAHIYDDGFQLYGDCSEVNASDTYVWIAFA